MPQINLSETELKLLKSILNDAFHERANMSCNDDYRSERELFTEEARKKICIIIHGEKDAKNLDYNLSNFDYVEYVQKIIEK